MMEQQPLIFFYVQKRIILIEPCMWQCSPHRCWNLDRHIIVLCKLVCGWTLQLGSFFRLNKKTIYVLYYVRPQTNMHNTISYNERLRNNRKVWRCHSRNASAMTIQCYFFVVTTSDDVASSSADSQSRIPPDR